MPGNQPSFHRQAPTATYYVRVFARTPRTSPPSNEISVAVP